MNWKSRIYDLIGRRGPMNMAGIVKELGAPNSSVEHTVKAMVLADLIIKEPSNLPRSRFQYRRQNGSSLPEMRTNKLPISLDDVRADKELSFAQLSIKLNGRIRHNRTLRIMHNVALLEGRQEFSDQDKQIVAEATRLIEKYGQVARAGALIKPLSIRLWGTRASPVTRSKLEERRHDSFVKAIGVLCSVCENSEDLVLPFLNSSDATALAKQIEVARQRLASLRNRILRGDHHE